MRLGHARCYNKYIPLSQRSHTMCICFSIQIMALPWCGPSPHPRSIQQKGKARTQTQTLAILRDSIWNWSFLELLTFHWLDLSHMIHLTTREAGKCSLVQCPGSQGEHALQESMHCRLCLSWFPFSHCAGWKEGFRGTK